VSSRSASLPAWRSVATRLDLLRSTGPRHAWRHWRQDLALRALERGRREQIARALWTDAAETLGAGVQELGAGRLVISRGSARTTVAGQTVTLDDPAAVTRAADKPAVYRLLAGAGLRVPEHEVFDARDLRRAKRFLESGPVPCVVKPAQGRGGDGVTCGIRTARDLRRASLSASRFAPRLLIERQIRGDVFRLLVLDREVLDVVRRLPPSVTGDGRSTVEELVFGEYERRIRADGDPGIKPFAVDLDCLLSLKQAGLSLRSVPAAGATVQVKTVTNYNRPIDNETLRAAVSRELSAAAVEAARVLGLRLAGVDVITPEPLASLEDGAGVISDLNAAPGLHHHVYVANGEAARPVAVPILNALLDE
jgi:D-alanine-D-alanine ligase-like ATP-grasp enzyme